MAKRCAKCATAVDMIGQMAQMLKEADLQLKRANRIIGWMSPYIGTMCPPENGLAEFNEHCCDNRVPAPGKEAKGAPIKQSLSLHPERI